MATRLPPWGAAETPRTPTPDRRGKQDKHFRPACSSTAPGSGHSAKWTLNPTLRAPHLRTLRAPRTQNSAPDSEQAKAQFGTLGIWTGLSLLPVPCEEAEGSALRSFCHAQDARNWLSSSTKAPSHSCSLEKLELGYPGGDSEHGICGLLWGQMTRQPPWPLASSHLGLCPSSWRKSLGVPWAHLMGMRQEVRFLDQ